MTKISPLTKKILRRFLKKVGDTLTGQWLLLGGTVLPLLGREYRVTTDIDLVGLGLKEQKQILSLMKVAEQLKLPIESINQAAGYFLRKTGFQQRDLIVLHQGKSATIFRPSCFLFIQLKLQRLSDTDLKDCLEYLKFCHNKKEPLAKRSLLKLITKEIKTSDSIHKIKRFQILENAVQHYKHTI